MDKKAPGVIWALFYDIFMGDAGKSWRECILFKRPTASSSGMNCTFPGSRSVSGLRRKRRRTRPQKINRVIFFIFFPENIHSMSVDRMGWHDGGDFPDDLPGECDGMHIGMFLARIMLNDLAGDIHREARPDALEATRNRQMTGRDFLNRECDEKFRDEDLNGEGQQFTTSYYIGEDNNGACVDAHTGAYMGERMGYAYA